MSKTVTLRLSEQVYETLMQAAKTDNRTLSNLIETLALRQLQSHRDSQALWSDESQFIEQRRTLNIPSTSRSWRRAELYEPS